MIRLAALLAIMATPAAAENVCMSRDDLAKELQRQYGEDSKGWLLVADESGIIEIYTSPKSWTLTVTNLSGRSCILADGGKWIIQGIPQGEPG